MAKSNLTMTTDITAQAREIDFVTRFARNWQALREIMGIMRPIKKTTGTVLRSYVSNCTLQDGNVAEGEEIPYSKTTVQEILHEDLTLQKYAKAVSIESVNTYGAPIAIQRTDDAFLNELQGQILEDFYGFVQTGTTRDAKATFQAAFAIALGHARDEFKKMHRDSTRTVAFINTMDLYEYYGTANITVQNRAGISYIENFMGADTVILSSDIPSGVVLATPVDNIVLYYIDPADSDFKALGLNYTVDGETNLIGFHANGNYATAVGESFALMGMKLWAEYMNGIAVVYIGTETTATAESVGTGDGTTKTFALDHGNVTSVTSVTVGGTATTAYTLDSAAGKITFDSAPANSAAIVATYKYAAAGA